MAPTTAAAVPSTTNQDTPAATAMARTAALKSRQLRSYRHLVMLRGSASGTGRIGSSTRRRRVRGKKPLRTCNRTITRTVTPPLSESLSSPPITSYLSVAVAQPLPSAPKAKSGPPKFKKDTKEAAIRIIQTSATESEQTIEIAANDTPNIQQGTDIVGVRHSPPAEKMFFDNRIKRKNVLALNEKVAAIREYQKTPVYKRIGRLFHCSPDQIKRIVQQKDIILKAWEQRTRRCQDAKTLQMKVVRVSMLGKAVYDWIRRMMYYQDIKISDALIQKRALQFKSAMALPNFFPHQEWCDKFRQTYNLTEEDSRQLNIGYTQGYSVQIKDVIKDVLSECTPDIVEGHANCAMDNIRDEEANAHTIADREEHKPKVALHFKDQKDENSNECHQPNAEIRNANNESKKSLLKVVPFSSDRAGTLMTSARSVQRDVGVAHSPTSSTSRIMPSLHPIRHMVALPLQTHGSARVPQKVLVATPIMSATAQARCGAPPMTMTIIPLATIGQSPSMPTSSLANPRQAATTASNEASTAIVASKPSNLLPIVAIKKEIKDEPMGTRDVIAVEELRVKDEIISDEEMEQVPLIAEELPSSPLTAEELPSSPVRTSMVAIAKSLDSTTPRITVISPSILRAPAAPRLLSTTPTTSREFDQVTLSNIRRLIHIPKLVEKVSPLFSGESSISKLGGRHKTPVTSGSPSPPPPPTLPAITPLAELMPSLPPLTRAPASVLPTLNRSAAQNLKFNADVSAAAAATQLPPIKCFSEARKYLKLLEDFALHKENIRLISLITRADEVLRELDGDEDVEID